MEIDLQDPEGVYQKPDYQLLLDGRNITQNLRGRLIRLSLRESRGEKADQLDIELDDSRDSLALPPVGARLALQLGYTRGGGWWDKGEYIIDEIEHSGAPDTIMLRARSAEMRQTLRQRASNSWHGATLGNVVRDIAKRNGMQANVDEALAGLPVQHIDQTNESDMHFLTRLGRQHDAVATVKKGRLVFLPIGSTRNASGKQLAAVQIRRQDGDRHRYHTAARDAYTGVRAYWHDNGRASRQAAIDGEEENLKTLKDSYATEDDAMAAARAERGRLQRGAATLEITLAIGDPSIMVQSPVTVSGFKEDIDGEQWLCKTVEHTLDDNGLTTRMEMERAGGEKTRQPGKRWSK
ncbi:MAG: contractile injection system protein, VgrG/Pvc8 family [Delftia tsuruhatensis]